MRASGEQRLSVSSTVDGGAAQSWNYSPVTLTAATGQTVVFRDGFGTVVGTFQMPACGVDYAADVAENGSYVFDRVPNASAAAPAPGHGTVIAQGDGTLRYTPTTGYTGPDSFGYSSPQRGGTVAITVVPINGVETFTWSDCHTATITNRTSLVHSYTWNNGSLSTVVARLAPGQSVAVVLDGGAGDDNNLTSDSGTELANWVPDTDECDTFTADTLTTSRDHSLTLDTFLGAFIGLDPGHGTATGEPTSNAVTYTPDHCYVGDDYFVYFEWKINVTHYVTVHVVGSPCATTSTGHETTPASSTGSGTTTPTAIGSGTTAAGSSRSGITTDSSAPPSDSTASPATTSQAASSSADLVPPPRPPASSAGLAFTGVNIGPLLTAGALLVLTGLVLLRVGRRRSGPFTSGKGAHLTGGSK
ncbi:MAG: Ig-like domain-containing protein [Actinomycetota bacterium]|nr:Ig-like domain-containing protein [Actinomycetota bacterium]